MYIKIDLVNMFQLYFPNGSIDNEEHRVLLLLRKRWNTNLNAWTQL